MKSLGWLYASILQQRKTLQLPQGEHIFTDVNELRFEGYDKDKDLYSKDG